MQLTYQAVVSSQSDPMCGSRCNPARDASVRERDVTATASWHMPHQWGLPFCA
jgi:hypothetical protein